MAPGFAPDGRQPGASGCTRYFPWPKLFLTALLKGAVAPLYRHYGASNIKHDNDSGGTKMEKYLVVAGIWSMCALCAVLFIRGATAPALRRVKAEDAGRPETAR